MWITFFIIVAVIAVMVAGGCIWIYFKVKYWGWGMYSGYMSTTSSQKKKQHESDVS